MTDSRKAEQWVPDVLGGNFEQLTLPLKPDAEGEVVATLVRYTAMRPLDLRTLPADGADVLYVHGWSDYFFQTHLAEYWRSMGARFYALDLRKYGRSLMPHQTPGFVDELSIYDEDIEAALEAMGHGAVKPGPRVHVDKRRPLILMGHSTGGLTLSLWAARHHGRAQALVLNSPWLEFQARGIGREVIAPAVVLGAKVAPLAPLPTVDLGFYTRTVSKDLDGEWVYNKQWRPQRGFPIHPAWLKAVLRGHGTVAAGIDVGVPVLSMMSTRSTISLVWSPAMLTSDSVLVVDDIAVRSLRLGPSVTVERLDDAIHDVILSSKPVREAAFAAMTRWLRGYLPR
ncbi:alpha/beta hydrolase [Microterricola viridarii]|uniref:Lysophospholipase, alpha-beta hydrolase superfamily n=1 Tax=Microterricola viridarii TaxID=412690 RepID=A0A1H1MYY7_9MICO|nr:alpha/beta hydrolase [Microterricola viridarii]SDR92111.1 Lysophospholipase, alpha-beta hydrolase superfamily [Microterricola viridarii]